MTPRRMILVAIAAVVAVVVGLSIGLGILGGGEVLDRGGDPDVQRALRREGRPESGADPTLVGRAPPPALPAHGEGAALPADGAGPAEVAAPGRIVLVGEVVGEGASPAGPLRVRVRGVAVGGRVLAEPVVEGTGDAAAGFRVDLAPLLPEGMVLAQVEVEVDHPECVVALVRVDLPTVGSLERRDIPVRVVLRPALVLAGTVTGEDGATVAGCQVAAFEWGVDGPVHPDMRRVEPAATGTTDDRGGFRLRVPAPGRYLVVASARGFVPAGREVTVRPGETAELAPLVLEAGASIEGLVLCEGTPVRDAPVHANPVTEGKWTHLGGFDGIGWVGWVAGRLGCWLYGCPTDQSGAFRIRGLWRGPHDVFVLLPDVPFPEEAARRVDAPARDVRIDLDPPVAVELDVEAGGRPAPRAGLEFVVGDGKTVYVVTASTEEDGTWRQTLAPGRTVRVTVTLAGFEPASLEFRTGGPGTQIQRRVVLSPSASASNLVVRLTGPDAAAVRSCWFHLERLDAPAVPPSVETGPGDIAPPTPLPVASGPEDRTETPAERDEAGNPVYRLADLAAGRYRLVVRPEASLMGETGFHVPDVRTVDLPPGGEALVDSEARLGGRLRVAARDESGRLLEASCRVLDARGEPQEVEFLTYGTDVSMRRGGRLGPYSPSTVVPPLLPGRYTLEFALDDRFLAARTVEVLVEAGRTTDVDVTLTP